jgi:hypothetical protein
VSPFGCVRMRRLYFQMSRLQSMNVYGLDDLAKQHAKSLGDLFQLVVEGISVHVLIDIAHQVAETFLLSAGYRVVCGVEVRHEDAADPV